MSFFSCLTYYLKFHTTKAFKAPNYIDSDRPTVFPYSDNTDFTLVHWQLKNEASARHLHQLPDTEYRTLFHNFKVFQNLSLVAHFYLLNLHLPTSTFTSSHTARRHFSIIRPKLTYPLTWLQYLTTATRFKEIAFKFQKLKLIKFAEFWPSISSTSEIILKRQKITTFLKHLPSISTTTIDWIRYQLNNTNGDFDITNPLVDKYWTFLDTFVHVDFPHDWLLLDHFQHILDPSIPINLHTFNTQQLQSTFAWTETKQILKNLTNFIAPPIDLKPLYEGHKRPDIRPYVPRFF